MGSGKGGYAVGALLIAVIYLAFVSLGLPDSLLGSGWPTMQAAFGVPSSYAGFISMMIAAMTIVSSLVGPRLIQKVETKWIVICSIALTILGLLGFSFAGSYWMLFLFAVPYGLGAGSIDAALNHYVATHYSSRVMNFLHCFYGLGAVISPNIMALALRFAHWNQGYRWVAYIQMGILAVCILSLPLWNAGEKTSEDTETSVVGIRDALKVPGVVLTLIAFFAYCSGETTGALWASSYFAGTKSGMSQELIAACGSLVFGGLMLGRLISGFISERVGDRRLIRLGILVELLGILLVILPFPRYLVTMAGLLIAGTGMGPVYPSIQHMAPENFGKQYSAPVIGLQMASAYTGTTFMPMVFGLLQQRFGIWIMPFMLFAFAAMNLILLELAYRSIRRTSDSRP